MEDKPSQGPNRMDPEYVRSQHAHELWAMMAETQHHYINAITLKLTINIYGKVFSTYYLAKVLL